MKGVNSTHPDYDAFAPIWEKIADVIAGQRAVHRAGKKYLPALADEETEQYAARLARSNFTNFTWRTIAGFQGMLFRKPPLADVPAAIRAHMSDITMTGQSMDTFARAATYEVLANDRVGILVDHPAPPAGAKLSVAAAEALGLRPHFSMYRAPSIINWRFERIRNEVKLSLVVLKEAARADADPYSHKMEDRWRELSLDDAGQYRQRVFRKGQKDEFEQVDDDIYPEINGKTLDFIPFFIANSEGEASDVGEPLLIDLVDANIAYYQVNSDRRHGLHFTGLPMLFLAGVDLGDGEKIKVGTQNAVISREPQAKGEYIEFRGQGLNAIKDYQAELRQEMAVMGARMLADETKAGVETLGATEIKRTGENSILSSIADALSEVLEKALSVFADWAGASGKVSYKLNKKFLPRPMSPQELTALVGAWQQGAISEGELFESLQQGEIIADDKTLAQHQAEIDTAPPPAPPKPNNDKNKGGTVA